MKEFPNRFIPTMVLAMMIALFLSFMVTDIYADVSTLVDYIHGTEEEQLEPLPWEAETDSLEYVYTLKEAGDFLRGAIPGLVDLELVVTENGEYRVDMLVDAERYYVVLEYVPQAGLIKAQAITDLYREWQER